MPLSVSLKLNTSDFSCLFFFTGPREVKDAILSIEQPVADVSATCDPIACVFGAVLISRQDRNFNIPLLFPDRTSILHDFGVRSRACTAPGRLASPISPISTLFIVSTTRLQASEDKNPSQVDDDCLGTCSPIFRHNSPTERDRYRLEKAQRTVSSFSPVRR